MAVHRMPIAARLHRVWRVAERIATNPGETRGTLADLFHLSERQVQADLNVIREDLQLPLIRKRGYRFITEGAASGAAVLSLHEAQLLLMVLDHAGRDPSIPSDRLGKLARRLVPVFPAHIQPVIAAITPVVRAQRPNPQQALLLALLNAMLRGTWVQLQRPGADSDPVVRPDILLPFRGHWYVLGECHRPSRLMAFDLTNVTSVTAVSVVDRVVRSVQPGGDRDLAALA